MVSNQSNKRVLQWLIVFINLSRILYGWAKEQKFYYGVRFKRGCHPNDLWTTYFTSSKVVQQHRKEFGEPDVIEVRRTFLWQGDAREWEHKVLRRLDVIHNEKWLNQSTGKTPYCSGEQHPLYGKSLNAETRKRIGEALKGEKNPLYGKPRNSETKRKISDAQKGEKHHFYGKKHSEETLRKMSDAQKGENHPNFGIPHSEETKKKISESMKGEKNHNFGKSFSEDHRKRMSDSRKGEKSHFYGKSQMTVYDKECNRCKSISKDLYNQNRDRYIHLQSNEYKKIKAASIEA